MDCELSPKGGVLPSHMTGVNRFREIRCRNVKLVLVSWRAFNTYTEKDTDAHLERLDLSVNRLERLPYEMAVDFHKLRLLNVSHNRISSIERELFKNSYAFEHLDFSYNRIISFDAVIKDMRLLRTVDVSHNQYVKFRELTFSAFYASNGNITGRIFRALRVAVPCNRRHLCWTLKTVTDLNIASDKDTMSCPEVDWSLRCYLHKCDVEQRVKLAKICDG